MPWVRAHRRRTKYGTTHVRSHLRRGKSGRRRKTYRLPPRWQIEREAERRKNETAVWLVEHRGEIIKRIGKGAAVATIEAVIVPELAPMVFGRAALSVTEKKWLVSFARSVLDI